MAEADDRWIGPALSLPLRCDIVKVRRRSVILPLVEGISAASWGSSLVGVLSLELLLTVEDTKYAEERKLKIKLRRETL